MGIQSHGVSHRYLADLDAAELDMELGASKQRLESIVGAPVIALALPGGRGGERERSAALRLGYADVLSSEPGDNRKWVRGKYLQRLAITRTLRLRAFARLVEWRGVQPRAQRLRYQVLAWVKRLVGNRQYERLRGWALPP
jgi:peptidoglycan/xylan/chitin deacetylase (PgdA/CDA1 family)